MILLQSVHGVCLIIPSRCQQCEVCDSCPSAGPSWSPSSSIPCSLFLLGTGLGSSVSLYPGEVTSPFLITFSLGFLLPSSRWAVKRGMWVLLPSKITSQDYLFWRTCYSHSRELPGEPRIRRHGGVGTIRNPINLSGSLFFIFNVNLFMRDRA